MMHEIEKALRVITGDISGEIRESLALLDNVVKESAESLPPGLAHFLEGRSYVKALAFIEKAKTSKP
tara:strand:- start:79 stop:279 length:201 start_codon:yes stop_codon:yes gene_type:complete